MQHCAIVISGLTHTRPGNTLKQPLDLLGAMREVICPEIVAWVLDQLNESDQKTPRMRPVHNETLQQNPCNLLFHDFLHSNSQLKGCMVFIQSMVCTNTVKLRVSTLKYTASLQRLR